MVANLVYLTRNRLGHFIYTVTRDCQRPLAPYGPVREGLKLSPAASALGATQIV